LRSGRRATEAEVEYGPFVPSHLLRRTGISGTDWVGCLVAVATLPLTVTSGVWFPWVFIVALVFGLSALLMRVELWPVTPSRVIPETLPVPALVPGEETVERAWGWPSRCRPLTSNVSLLVRVKMVASRAAANPSRAGLTSLSSWEQAVTELVRNGATDREA